LFQGEGNKMTVQPNTSEKTTISWAEMILLALLILCGIGILASVEREVKLDALGNQPVQETYLKTSEAIRQEVELATAQSELQAIEKAVQGTRLELAIQVWALDTLKLAFPTLEKTSLSPAQAATISSSVIQECAEALTLVETTEKLITSFTQQHTSLSENSTKLQLSLKAMDSQTLESLFAQSQLDLLKAELVSIQEELVKQQVALPQYKIALETLKKTYPELFGQFSLLGSQSSTPPASVIGDYLSAVAKIAQLQTALDRLQIEQITTQNSVISHSENLTQLHETALRSFKSAEQQWTRQQGFEILWFSVAGIALLLVLVVAILKWINQSRLLKIGTRTVLVPTFWILSPVIGYQTFGVTGATIALVISSPVALWFFRPRTQAQRQPEW
jgi:hypothetical protein